MYRSLALPNRLARLTALLSCSIALLPAPPAFAASLVELQTPQGTTPGRTQVFAISGDGLGSGGEAENNNGDFGAVIWGVNGIPGTGEFVIDANTPGYVTSVAGPNNQPHYTHIQGDDAYAARFNGSE